MDVGNLGERKKRDKKKLHRTVESRKLVEKGKRQRSKRSVKEVGLFESFI